MNWKAFNLAAEIFYQKQLMNRSNTIFIILSLVWACGLPLNAQSKKISLTNLDFTVERADDWTALFKRNDGWFGGDGIYSIPLDGRENIYAGKNSKILFIFSDSMIGRVTESTMLPGYKMIHNSVAYLDGAKPIADSLHIFWKTNTDQQPESIFSPKTQQAASGDYYWLGDGFVNQELSALYLFGYRIHNFSTDAFGFKEVGNTIIKVNTKNDLPNAVQQQFDTPFYIDDHGNIASFGAGIYVDTKKAVATAPDGFVYVYGVKGLDKQLLVARVKPKDFEKFAQWRFWDGNDWVGKMSSAIAVTDNVSNELSLSQLPDGRYALVFQIGGMTDIVGMRIGASPFGPFGPIIKLWDCKPDLQGKTYVVYNAKAHPSLSATGELLISYNINSIDFIKDLKQNPHLYRPRFIRVRFK